MNGGAEGLVAVALVVLVARVAQVVFGSSWWCWFCRWCRFFISSMNRYMELGSGGDEENPLVMRGIRQPSTNLFDALPWILYVQFVDFFGVSTHRRTLSLTGVW
ncbi:hypothetical protein HanXRQr2_Chr08g0330601 [Helianthus annuus]|uniref:Uncharacterized protein n=1 Tax=Helianthus annuus TaxID=4232 RepID=A0A251U410_HELAN|nr:hypothetical protein HanXRQr2_Chr08g0330601 [Helianthus annuus]